MPQTPLFDDAQTVATFPTPIAHAVDELLYELEESGEETTADETAAAIEATFCHLGRLWVAEYLYAVDANADLANEALNRSLLERAASGRHTLTGQWVGLSRRVWTHFKAHGVSTVLKDLAAVDFGTFGDDEHPVARLLHFRNHFSHGSFQSTVDGIREHRQLLHDLLAKLPCLREQPAHVREAESGAVRLANKDWTVLETAPDIDLPDAHPVILGANGEALDLYPLLHLDYDGGSPTLAPPNQSHPAREMFTRAAFSVWLERYERDRNGFLAYDGPTDAQAFPTAATDGAGEQTGLRAALAAATPGLILVEGFPGCGTEAAVAALDQSDPLSLGLDRFAAVHRVTIREGDLGQSGLTVGRIVLRLIERALGQEEGSTASSAKDLLAADGPLKEACTALAKANKQVLLGLEGLHRGSAAYRGEPFSVRDVYEALADSPVVVVATTVPGGIERPLFDQKVSVPVIDQPDLDDIKGGVDQLCPEKSLHQRVLRALARAQGPLHLFSLCDAVESDGGDAVFEPAVERALWDLRPLLTWKREQTEVEAGVSERVRLWAPFSTALSTGLLGGAA